MTRIMSILVLVTLAAGCASPALVASSPPVASSVLRCREPCLVEIDRGARWEPTVVADPSRAGRIVAASHDVTQDAATGVNSYWPLVHVSEDGGATWTTKRLPGGASEDPRHPLFRYNAMGDSALAFLPDGSLLWAALPDDRVSRPNVPYAATGDPLVVLRSPDGGRTFPDVVEVKSGSGAYGRVGVLMDAQDKEWMAVGKDGLVLLAWVRIEATDADHPSPLESVASILVAASRDGGRSWSPPSVIASGARLQGPFPLVLDDGAWLVTFLDQSKPLAVAALSHDEGKTWTSSPIGASTKFPVLAKSSGASGTRVYVAYPASEKGPDSAQTPTLRWSDDDGVSWSAPLALDESEGAGRTIPTLAVLADGTVLSTFWHPLEGNARLVAVAVRDGVVVGNVTLDETRGMTSDLGDYMGLSPLAQGGAVAVWNARHASGMAVMSARLDVAALNS